MTRKIINERCSFHSQHKQSRGQAPRKKDQGQSPRLVHHACSPPSIDKSSCSLKCSCVGQRTTLYAPFSFRESGRKEQKDSFRGCIYALLCSPCHESPAKARLRLLGHYSVVPSSFESAWVRGIYHTNNRPSFFYFSIVSDSCS